MKILHVIRSLDSRFGGPITVLWGLAKGLAQAGHNVTIYTTHLSQEVKGVLKEEKEGVKVCSFPGFSPMRFSPYLSKQLRCQITQFNIVHIHGLYRFPPTFAAWVTRKRKIPYIIRPHGSLDPFIYKQSRFGKWALPIKRIYEHLFDIPNLNHANAIHYTAQEEMERTSFLKLKGPGIVIPNGLDWQLYEVLPKRGGLRAKIGLNIGMPLILFLGRISFKKGLDLLIPAFSQVLNTIPEARLAIVGPDDEGYGSNVKRWCREHNIEDKVIFVDHLDSASVIQAYVDADVFVLSSYTENFGMTVVEAMACECPVIISDQVNIWREVQQAGGGLVVGLDVEQIADAVCNLLQNRAMAEEMGKRGRLAVKEKYTWPQIVVELTRVYEQLIRESESERKGYNLS